MRFLLVLLVLWPLSAQAGWFSYDSYDDCMLGKMKGQNQTMYSNADKECKKQFKVEFGLYKGDVSWEFHYSAGETIILITGSGEYEVTEGTFTFSEKECATTSPADFTKPAKVKFISGEGKYAGSVHMMQCAMAQEFTGRYK